MSKRLYKGHWFPIVDPQHGRFALGEVVKWRAKATQPEHVGTIILVVPERKWPSLLGKAFTPPVPNFKGYWRDHESYVVQDEKGKRWWPRVGNLEKVR